MSHSLSDSHSTTPQSLPALKALLEPQMTQLGSFFETQYDAFPSELHPYLEHAFRGKGKRLRATLLFLAGWNPQATTNEALIRAAAIIELIHYATLVHDDVLDDASVRQNHTTTNAEYGASVAILLGDALFAHALTLASQYPTTQVCQIVSEATRAVCTGEIAQTFHRNGELITTDNYHRIIELKTAELFSASTRLGALLAGYPEDFVQKAHEFGENLGIAYQIYDDATDCWSNQTAIGKTLGTDLESGKLTLPILLLLEKMPTDLASRTLTQIQQKTLTLGALQAYLDQYQILTSVKNRFENYIAQAKNALQNYSNRPPVPLLLSALEQIENLWQTAQMQ